MLKERRRDIRELAVGAMSTDPLAMLEVTLQGAQRGSEPDPNVHFYKAAVRKLLSALAHPACQAKPAPGQALPRLGEGQSQLLQLLCFVPAGLPVPPSHRLLRGTL
jgi:hypothetical protein